MSDTAPTSEKLEDKIEELEELVSDLEIDIEDLQEELAQAFFLDSYAMPDEVAKKLIGELAGWPAKRWRELAALIEAHVRRSVDA